MRRITIQIGDELHGEATELAQLKGISLAGLVREALSERLQRNRDRPYRKIPVYHGRGGLQPGVDLSNNAALRELLEADEPFIQQLKASRS